MFFKRGQSSVKRASCLSRIAVATSSYAFNTVKKVLNANKGELFVVVFIGMIVIIISASAMYLVEPRTNEAFNSIPDSMWWAVETLTSVGYGDALPVTQAGKILGSIIALTGISFVALPAGILGAGFLEEFQNRRNEKQKTTTNSESLGVATEIREYVRCETTDIYKNRRHVPCRVLFVLPRHSRKAPVQR